MKKKTPLRAAVPSKIKNQAELILSKLGLTPSAAIELFYRQIIHQQGLPFKIALSDQEELRPLAYQKLSPTALDHELNLGLAALKKKANFSTEEVAHLTDQPQKKQNSGSKVYYSAAAVSDLNNITDYLVSFNDGQGQEVVTKLQQEISRLGQKDRKHHLLQQEPWHALGIYQANLGRFTVFYQISKRQQQIELLRLMVNVKDLSELED